jgi:hypothetical protein
MILCSAIGGDKTGDGRLYDVFVPIADRLYGAHLAQLKKEQQKDSPKQRKKDG